jgi:outer membrane PBP1 activator LpoA protein
VTYVEGQQRVAANRECGMHRGAGRVYRIVVRSELSERYAAAFEEMEMETKGGLTVLTGEVVDQIQLHGIIDRIGGMGLELVSVQSLPEGIQNEG